MRTRSLSPTEPEHSETKEKIIQGAMRVFSRYSVDMASMRMIAKEAKVTLSLLIYHFQNKETIYQTVLDRVYAIYARRFQEVFARIESTDKLKKKEAVEILRELIRITVTSLCHDLPALDWKGRIILYEYVYPSFHYEAFYSKHVKRYYGLWVKVIMAVTGNDDEKASYFQAVVIFGHVAGFRLQNEMLKRSISMNDMSPQDLETIVKMVTDNTLFMLGVR